MGDERRLWTFDRVVRVGIAAGFLAALVWLLGYLSDVLIPFAVALLLAYLMNPLVSLVQKRVRSRLAAVLVSLLLVLAGLVLLGWLLVPVIVGEVGRMGGLLADLVRDSDLAQRAAERLPPDLWQAVKDYAARQEVREFFTVENFWKAAEAVLRKVLPGAWGLISGTLSFLMSLFGVFTIGLYLVFLLLDYQKVREGWPQLIPPRYREQVVAFLRDFNFAMSRYFRARAGVAAIVGALSAFGFWLIGLPMGILLGMLMGLLNMVPYLQLAGLVPAAFLALFHSLETGTSLWIVMAMTLGVFVAVQVIEDALLVPRIMGRATGLSPAMILLSLSVWGKLLGIFGLLIALPMTCLLLAYYRRFLAAREASVPSTAESGGE